MSSEENNDVLSAEKQRVVKIPCIVYSRIVGYLSPLNNWNIGMRASFEARKEYSQEKFSEKV